MSDRKPERTYPDRVVIITQDFFPDVGGITTWVHEFARHLSGAGCEVLVVTKSFDGFNGGETVSYPVLRLDHRGWKKHKYARIRKAIAPLNAGDTVFLCANWKMAVPCLSLSFTTSIRYFVVVHGLDALEARFKNRLLQKLALWRAEAVLPVSRYTASLIEMPRLHRSGRMQVVPNGVDCSVFVPQERNTKIEQKYGLGDGPRILNIGRLIPRKGFDMTIRAMALVRDKSACFYIGGTGPYENELRRIVAELALEDRVTFLGFVPDDDLVDLYNACDVFCMPSRALPLNVEGFGLTYLEAAACGVPSIGGKNSGAEDAIVDGETGLLVDAESPEAIADALNWLAADRDFRNQLGEQALKRVRESFGWHHATQRLLGIIRHPA